MNTRAGYECGIFLVVSFAILASASTPLWARVILAGLIFVSTAVFLVISKRNWERIPETRRGYIFSALILAVPLFQLIPLPAILLEWLNPVHFAKIGGLVSEGLLQPVWFYRTSSVYPFRTGEQLLLLAALIFLFWIARFTFSGFEAQKRCFLFLIFFGSFQAILGLLQYFKALPVFFPGRIFPDVVPAVGTYVNRNHFAGLMEMSLAILVGFMYYFFSTRISPDLPAQRNRWRTLATHQNFPKLLLLAFIGLIISLSLVFSLSRSGIVCALAALFFMGFLVSIRHGRRKIQILVFLFVLGIGCYATWIGLEPVLGRFDQLLQTQNLESIPRIPVWKATLTMIADFPLLGTGLGTYETVFFAYNSLPLTVVFDHAHNDFLEYTAELGIPGAIYLFTLVLVVWARAILLFFRSDHPVERMAALGGGGAVFSILIHSLTDFNLQIPANMVVFTILMAILTVTATTERRTDY